MELGTGLSFAAVAFHFSGLLPFDNNLASLLGSLAVLIAFLYFAAVSIALCFIDIETHTLPNRIVYPSFLVALVLLGAAAALLDRWDALGGAGLGLVSLLALYFILALLYPGGMGFGDVKLSAVIGLQLGWLGWDALAVGAFAPFLLGGVFAIVLVVFRKAGRKSGIPFGPWMLLGAWIGIIFGQQIATAYLALYGLN